MFRRLAPLMIASLFTILSALPAAAATNVVHTTIPFNETRDYVKKVLSNSVTYAALLGAPAPTLKSRLGPSIGPRDPGSAASDRDLP